MAFGRGKKKGNSVRLTGMWPSDKNQDLMTGSIKPEEVENLATVVERALNEQKGLFFMLWDNAKFIKGANDDQKRAPYSLSVDVSEPLPKQEGVAPLRGRFNRTPEAQAAAPARTSIKRAIEPDPGDDPFARE